MPETQKKNYGKELLAWDISEYPAHSRGTAWYFAMVLTGVAFLIWAVVTRNFLFAFIVIMFGIVFATHALHPPRRYTFAIHELGIRLGERFYRWREMKQFWIVYEPPEVKTLYVDFGGFKPRLPVPLEEVDPNSVRQVLGGMLSEDTAREDEPISDWLARVLKI